VPVLILEKSSGAAYLGESPICSESLPTTATFPSEIFANPKSHIIAKKKFKNDYIFVVEKKEKK